MSATPSVMTETMDPSSVAGDPSLPPNVEQTVQAVDVSVLIDYLKRIVPALMEEDNVLRKSFRQLIEDPAQKEKMIKFITDPQVKSILIQRSSVKG